MSPVRHQPCVIRPASLLAASVAGLVWISSFAQGQVASVITNVADVRALSSAQAAEARAVKLRGVVVDLSDPREHAVIVADDTGGLYALANTNLFAPNHRGDLLELTGVTDPGEFAPIVKVSDARWLGTAPLPEPLAVSYDQLISGEMDAQWVEISGVIQNCSPTEPDSDDRRAVLLVNGGALHVIIRGPQNTNLVVDARVRVAAVCLYQFNQNRQLLNPVLVVPRGLSILIEQPAPADPFAAPILAADSLLRYSQVRNSGHRVHVRGVVTYNQSGSSVWIRDAASGLRLQTSSPEIAQVGDMIDVLGFPKYGATPVLEEATFRKLGPTNPPVPLALNHPTNSFNNENNLVSVEAMLTEIAPVPEGVALTLESEGTVFKAVLKQPSQTAQKPDWQPGSRVRVTGICSVIYDESKPVMGVWHPQSFQLLLRSPADVTVLRAPSWWTLNHIVYLLGVITGGLLLATGAITVVARRRLREQAQHRAMAEAEFAAILSERNRMAREIHDTLAHGLTAISFRLRAAKVHATSAGDLLNQQLDAAQEDVRKSLAEARDSIWNMRSQVLETGDLPGALKNILKEMADGSGCQTDFQVTGDSRRLAPVTENNLLRLGQEAITNATRHAQARQIKVQLAFSEKQFRLSVWDDGCGFDTAHLRKSQGGFGLVGMRERAKEMQGELDIRSVPGKGTEVTLTIPLSG